MDTARKLLWPYVALGCLTFIFQIWWRSGFCSDNCALNFAKGAIWYNESGAKPNTIVRFDPKTEKFQTWAIPGGGDIVRNMDVTPDGNPVTANSLVNQVGLVEVK